MFIDSVADYDRFICRTAAKIRQYGKWTFDVLIEDEFGQYDERFTVRTTKTARRSCLENYLKNKIAGHFKLNRNEFLSWILGHVIAVDWNKGYKY